MIKVSINKKKNNIWAILTFVIFSNVSNFAQLKIFHFDLLIFDHNKSVPMYSDNVYVKFHTNLNNNSHVIE